MASENSLKQFPRLVLPADEAKRVRVPEIACEKRCLGRAEIIIGSIAHNAPVAHQFASYDVASAAKARIRRRKQTEFGAQQYACVKIAMSESASQRAAFLVPRLSENPVFDRDRVRIPVLRPIRKAQSMCNLPEAITCGPA